MIFEVETCTDSHYFMFNFYQINRNCVIWTRDHLIIKALISSQKTNSTKKLELLNKF
jgi:hypothetical protein